jgi:hypothetical protein
LCDTETTETILAYGHMNIQAKHGTTIEITKDAKLTRQGDCIIAVAANKGLPDLSSEFKENLRRNVAELTVSIEAGGSIEVVNARGNAQLVLSHPTDIVIRKSSHISDRTLAIQADKAAADLSRELIDMLKNPTRKVKITLTVRT